MKKIIMVFLSMIYLYSNNYAYDFNTEDTLYIEKISTIIIDYIDTKNEISSDMIITALEKYQEKNTLSERMIYILNTTKENINNHYSPEIKYPTGIYVSAGPTQGTNLSVKENLLEYDFVNGVLLRINWNQIEETKNSYDFSKIHEQIELAKKYNKKISLAIGSQMPTWLEKEVQYIEFEVRDKTKMVLPWDSIFLSEWKELIAKLGAEFSDEETISLIYITNASFNGYEMQFPHGMDKNTWETRGYSDTAIIDSWKQVIDSFNNAFPKHPLTSDYHPILESDIPQQEIYDYAQKKLGKRYGASAWWWTEKNTSIYPVSYEILQESAKNSFATLQVARNATEQESMMGENGFSGTMQLAIDNNICYWEIWEKDIKNINLHEYLDTLECK